MADAIHISTFHRRIRLWAALAGLILLAGCNAPAVERVSEIERFRGALATRTAALHLQTGEVLTMRRCEELALANSLDLAVRRQTYRLEDPKVRAALATGLPSARLVYTEQMRSNQNLVEQYGMTAPADKRHQQDLSINATVPVLDFGITYYSWQIARDQRTQQALLLRRSEQTLRRDVRIAYARHASELRQLKLTLANVRAGEEVLRVAAAQEREGLATGAETAVVRAALAQARVDQASAAQRVAETRLALAQLLSLPPDTPITVDERLPELPEAPDAAALDRLADHALRVRPELHSQDLEEHLSANQVRREIAGFFPQIDGIGSFNWSSNPFMANPAYFLGGFQVAQSLLDGTTRLTRVEGARIIVDVERERALLLSLGVLYEVELRAIQLHRGRETITALQEQEKARSQAFARIFSLYKEGLESQAGTAKALADLSMETAEVDRAETDYLVWWYEFAAAALPDEAEPGAPAATQPGAATRDSGGAPAATSSPATESAPRRGEGTGNP